MTFFRRVMTCFLVISGFFAISAQAEQRIGVVDFRAALLSSEAAKQFGEQLKKDFADEEARLREVGESAQTLQERLKKDTAIMSDAERSKLSEELEEKAQEFNFLKKKYQNAISKREEQFLQESKPKVDDAIKAIAAQEGIDIILPSKLIVYADQGLDLTAKLVEALNAK